MSNVVLFSLILHLDAKVKRKIEKCNQFASILYTRKLQNECEYFIGEKKIVKASIFVDFCEHLKFREDIWREHLKILVIKNRIKRLFSRSKKARKKNLCGTGTEEIKG